MLFLNRKIFFSKATTFSEKISQTHKKFSPQAGGKERMLFCFYSIPLRAPPTLSDKSPGSTPPLTMSSWARQTETLFLTPPGKNLFAHLSLLNSPRGSFHSNVKSAVISLSDLCVDLSFFGSSLANLIPFPAILRKQSKLIFSLTGLSTANR